MRRIALALLLVWSSPALAGETPWQPENADCTAAIATAEHTGDIPAGLLAAIGRVESGRADPTSGAVRPWPWTIDADGAGHFFATKAEAVTAVMELRARGVLSIDVGCMQINLMHHPAAFASLQEAFDPLANALYAARFLNKLFRATGDWSAAVAAYHSQTRDVGAAYEEKVLAARSSPDSASAPAVAARSRGFVLPDWIDAAVAARREPAAVGIAAPLAEGPEPAPPSGWVERAIAAVARCPAAIEPRQPPTDGGSGRGAAVWKAAGICPTSPFATPAALRRLLVDP